MIGCYKGYRETSDALEFRILKFFSLSAHQFYIRFTKQIHKTMNTVKSVLIFYIDILSHFEIGNFCDGPFRRHDVLSRKILFMRVVVSYIRDRLN